jgi:AcrR family transcriptional regulator
MPPRPYHPVERRRTVDAGRERILAAAREILHLDDVAAFSLEAVARRAGVTRMTLYNQFGSKAGLLEELFDLLMERGAFQDMPMVFSEPDTAAAFDGFVAILGHFYTENRQVLTSLSAAAGTDPDLDEAMRVRNQLRRRAIETLIQRLGASHRPGVAAGELVNTVDVLLSFNTFNAIAGPNRTPTAVVPLMRQLLRSVVGDGSRKPPGRAKTAASKKR